MGTLKLGIHKWPCGATPPDKLRRMEQPIVTLWQVWKQMSRILIFFMSTRVLAPPIIFNTPHTCWSSCSLGAVRCSSRSLPELPRDPAAAPCRDRVSRPQKHKLTQTHDKKVQTKKLSSLGTQQNHPIRTKKAGQDKTLDSGSAQHVGG